MITKPMLTNFRNDFADTVKALEAKYKVKIDLGTISYSETSFHSKMTVTESSLGENGTPVVSEAHFKKCAKMLDVPETWLNLEFTGSNGELLKIVGLNPRKPKNSVELVGVKSGRKYQASIQFVQSRLGGQKSEKMSIITQSEYLSLTTKERQWIEKIYNDLSPENLTCDGELSRSAVSQKASKLNTQMNNIQNRIGKIVPEDLVYDNLLSR